MDVRTSGDNGSCGSAHCSIGIEGLVCLARGQVGQINRGWCRRTKSAGGKGASHRDRIGGVEVGPAVAMMRIPRLHFSSPVEDPVLAETDINLVAHPDVEKELRVCAFGALRGVGIGKDRRIKTVVRVNATKVRNVSG